ncbi:hypothetical protein FRC09_007691, partial [Ceratobasidium sp. 395]
THLRRFESQGASEDLDLAVNYLCEAVSLSSEAHLHTPVHLSNLAVQLSNLGTVYHSRFELQGDPEDLKMAIDHELRAASLTSERHAHRPMILNNLGISYHKRFELLEQLEDLDTAIEYKRQAVFLTPDDNVDKSRWLNGLGTSYHCRFERLGNLADLDLAISCKRKAALEIQTGGTREKPLNFASLASSYHSRYEHLGELADLDLAVDFSEKALYAAPENYPYKSRIVSYIGNGYRSRFERLGNGLDLNTAIGYLGQAVSLLPEGHPDMPASLNNLGASYQSRFRHLGELEDLDLAIKHKTHAVSLIPQGHPDKPTQLNNLGVSYRSRFERFGELDDINMAIDCERQATLLLPKGHPDEPMWLMNLSISYYNRFELSNDTNDLRDSIDCSMRAARSSTGSSFLRFQAACTWALLSADYSSSSQLDAYGQAISLLPQVVWLGKPTEGQYKSVASIDSIALESALAAIGMKKYDLALEWLEEGRSIVWNQMLQLRTPLDHLSSINKPLAEELRLVSLELESTSSTNNSCLTLDPDHSTLEQAAQRQRRLAEKREYLVEQARLLPGMHDFLRPKAASNLLAATRTGAVVLVIVHPDRCCALVAPPNATDIRFVSLDDFTFEKANNARAQLLRSLHSQGRAVRKVTYHSPVEYTMEVMLKMLWTDVARPVLDVLGYTRQVGHVDNLPHITWCATGPLSFLPLHAAGDYAQDGCSLLDYAVSSYTPTLQALLAKTLESPATPKILAIGQSHTTGLSPLPGTTTELNNIGVNAAYMHITRLEDDKATVSTALTALDDHNWAHFACHASQNTANPSSSAFYLHDGPLNLAHISHKQLPNADLAFLSACQTAAGDVELSEESLHLAAGMIMAGYRRVIATMWSIDDEDAPIVAEKFYEYMLSNNRPEQNKAAKALYYAIGYLRRATGARSFIRWVPYIHMGI